MTANRSVNDEYEQASRKILDELIPELKQYVCKIDGSYWIHSPLLIVFGITHLSSANLNRAYLQKKALADNYLANIRFDPMAYLVLIEKPYRLDAFLELQDKLTDAQYWRCLEYVWSISEYVHSHIDTWLDLFRSNRRYRALMANRPDRKHFDALPDTLTIYRGYQAGQYRHKLGLAWTLSKEKAVWFAYRRPENGKPMVAKGTCKKSDVICYTNDRQEEEIIIDPKKITHIRLVRDIGPSPFKS